jgi:hypothetical protein
MRKTVFFPPDKSKNPQKKNIGQGSKRRTLPNLSLWQLNLLHTITYDKI